MERQRGFGLQMRIGLNTGLVVVGKIGDDLRMDYTAVGDTTNVPRACNNWRVLAVWCAVRRPIS